MSRDQELGTSSDPAKLDWGVVVIINNKSHYVGPMVRENAVALVEKANKRKGCLATTIKLVPRHDFERFLELELV